MSELRRVAEAGDREAVYQLGERMLARGYQADALEWWRRAERQGHPRAICRLAAWYEQDGDLARAEQLWRQAAEAGDPSGAGGLGRLLTYRDELTEACEWLGIAATAGDREAAFHLGRLSEASADVKAAKRWYRQAAEAGHRAAAVALGVLLAGNDPDSYGWSDASERWWKRATTGVDADAARELGQLLGWTTEVIDTEYELRTACEAGDPMASYRLARLLEERGGGAEEEWGAWWEHAVQQFTSTLASTMQASEVLDKTFRGSRKAFERGRKIIPSGLDSPLVRAHLYVRTWLADWRLPTLPSRLPIREFFTPWLVAQSEAGDTEATFLLGRMELAAHNRLGSDDTTSAEPWLHRAAEAGHGQAAYDLAEIRAEAEDHEGALYWYQRAAALGHPAGACKVAVGCQDTDVTMAEEQCHTSALAGHLPAAVLLRVIRHQPKPGPATGHGPVNSAVPESQVRELLALWDEISGHAPAPESCVDYLVERTGLPSDDVVRVRRVRNQCAHPADRGWPSKYDIDVALAIGEELRRQLKRE